MIRLLLLLTGVTSGTAAGILLQGKLGYFELRAPFAGPEGWYFLVGLTIVAVLFLVLTFSLRRWAR